MHWRKITCCLLIALCLSAWGAGAEGKTTDRELVDLLRQKNLISQEEADRLTKKIEETEKKEKEDIKKEVAKGDYLPAALKGVKTQLDDLRLLGGQEQIRRQRRQHQPVRPG